MGKPNKKDYLHPELKGITRTSFEDDAQFDDHLGINQVPTHWKELLNKQK